MNDTINKITKKLLEIVSDYKDGFKGAYNIRENGKCAGRMSSENITIETKQDKPGINIIVRAGTKGETVYIPSCVTEGGIDDLVYNDFFIGEDCDITIVAGCGVHTDNSSEAQHNGIHGFNVGKNSRVIYEEKHIGTGDGNGSKSINPVTVANLAENSYLEINATQISGVDNAYRRTSAVLEKNAHIVVRERLLTEKEQVSKTHFKVELNGDGSSADLVSRSVARDNSYQSLISTIIGNAECSGHSECDSIIDEDAIVEATPSLYARNKNASLIHEAAIGKIAGEQILKLRTLGLTEEEAEQEIIEGFLA